jgi:hypothetical protein
VARLKRPLFALIGSLLLGLLVWAAGGAMRAFHGGERTTDARSDRFPTAAERVAFLAKYVKLHSAVEDAAYHIVFHDNGFAPSDWDMVVAVRLPEDALPAWLASAERHAGPAGFAHQRIVPAGWPLTDAPAFYRRPGTSLVAFARDRVLVMRISSM